MENDKKGFFSRRSKKSKGCCDVKIVPRSDQEKDKSE